MTPPPGSAGGLLNAIFGSVVMTLIATLIGTPTGILAGTFLAEYSPRQPVWRGRPLHQRHPAERAVNHRRPVRLRMMVVRMGHFSAWAGVVALAIIVIPVVVRTTEDMLNLVPNALREAAAALGSPKWKVVVMIAYRAACRAS